MGEPIVGAPKRRDRDADAGVTAMTEAPESSAAIAQYMPLVKSRARSYLRSVHRYLEIDDLIAVGMAAVWTAAETWRPEGGASFGTYVTTIVDRAMLAQKTHLMKSKRHAGTVSLTVGEGDDEQQWELDGGWETPEQLAFAVVRAHAVQGAIDALPHRERDLIERRFWNDQTLEEVGHDMGLTKQRVAQIQDEAFRMMRPRLVFLRAPGLSPMARLKVTERRKRHDYMMAYNHRCAE